MRKSEIRKIKKLNRVNLFRRPTNTPEEKTRKLSFNLWTFTSVILCLGLAVWSINIYRNTFIDWRKLILPTIVGGIISTLFFYRKIKKQGETIWAILFTCLICGGSLIHFLIMFFNQKFANYNEIKTLTFKIEKKGKLAKGKGNDCAQPYVVINFENIEKQVVFSCKEDENVFKAASLEIEYCRGFFGFEIMKSKTLK